MNVERQFKLRGIPITHVPPADSIAISPALEHIQSSLARSVPALCVQSMDILSGAPAAEAAMPNIRVIPLNWWSEKKAQVIASAYWQFSTNAVFTGCHLRQAQVCSTTHGQEYCRYQYNYSSFKADNLRYHRGSGFIPFGECRHMCRRVSRGMGTSFKDGCHCA
jgi:hypothetical protein